MCVYIYIYFPMHPCLSCIIFIKTSRPPAPMSRSSNDSRYTLWSPDLNQMIHDTRFEVPIWIKWFTLWSPDLNQMIHDTRFEVPIWIKWFTIHALKFRSESNDSHFEDPIWIKWFTIHALKFRSESNDSHFEVPIWIKWFTIHTLKSRSESNDSRYTLWRPNLNQMICDTRFNWSASKQWIILRPNGLTDLEFQKAPLILCSLLALSIYIYLSFE